MGRAAPLLPANREEVAWGEERTGEGTRREGEEAVQDGMRGLPASPGGGARRKTAEARNEEGRKGRAEEKDGERGRLAGCPHLVVEHHVPVVEGPPLRVLTHQADGIRALRQLGSSASAETLAPFPGCMAGTTEASRRGLSCR